MGMAGDRGSVQKSSTYRRDNEAIRRVVESSEDGDQGRRILYRWYDRKRKVSFRQLIALDIDEGSPEVLSDLRAWLSGHSYLIHSTHSSTPEKPRYRVIAPLDRIVVADEYGALMRVLYDQFHLPIDVATFDFNRIMFLPSVPKDADYFSRRRPVRSCASRSC